MSNSHSSFPNLSDISDEVAIVTAPPSRKGGHPVVNANLNNFAIKDDIKDDGLEYFVIDGNEYSARSVGVENLRRFFSKNKVKTSTYPHRSLSRDGHLNQILVEITLMKARRGLTHGPKEKLKRQKATRNQPSLDTA
jgi:hypothetical protein